MATPPGTPMVGIITIGNYSGNYSIGTGNYSNQVIIPGTGNYHRCTGNYYQPVIIPGTPMVGIICTAQDAGSRAHTYDLEGKESGRY